MLSRSTYRLVFLQEPALTEKEVSLLEENIDDPISAVKQLGRVSFASDSHSTQSKISNWKCSRWRTKLLEVHKTKKHEVVRVIHVVNVATKRKFSYFRDFDLASVFHSSHDYTSVTLKN